MCLVASRFTLAECDGVGIALEGSVFSVGLCFSDARRHGEREVWLKMVDGRLVGLEVGERWELSEVDHAAG